MKDPVIRIAHVSDPHLGAHSATAVHDLAVDVVATRPTVTVVTGDLTMRARTAQFRQARELIDRLPLPRIVVIGNHDVPLFNVVSRFARPYARYRAHIDDELDPVLDVPGLRLLGLGSAPRWRWKSGRVSTRQTDRVVEVLGTAPPATVRVLALHHPPWQGGLARLVGRRRMLECLVAARVDLVLAGHTHVPSCRRVVLPDGAGGHPLIEVVAGTATSTRIRQAPRSWTLIRLDGAAITVENRFHGTSWHGGDTTRYPAPHGFTRPG
jgi:3',5'-cyclic AMP phosphodiesterase CpdA